VIARWHRVLAHTTSLLLLGWMLADFTLNLSDYTANRALMLRSGEECDSDVSPRLDFCQNVGSARERFTPATSPTALHTLPDPRAG
jgi:hypothetical protein